MQQIKSLLTKYEDKTQVEQSPPKKIDFEYQMLGIEMTSHFGKEKRKQIWPLFYKYSLPLIRESWFEYQKTGKTSFQYFMGILHKKRR